MLIDGKFSEGKQRRTVLSVSASKQAPPHPLTALPDNIFNEICSFLPETHPKIGVTQAMADCTGFAVTSSVLLLINVAVLAALFFYSRRCMDGKLRPSIIQLAERSPDFTKRPDKIEWLHIPKTGKVEASLLQTEAEWEGVPWQEAS